VADQPARVNVWPFTFGRKCRVRCSRLHRVLAMTGTGAVTQPTLQPTRVPCPDIPVKRNTPPAVERQILANLAADHDLVARIGHRAGRDRLGRAGGHYCLSRGTGRHVCRLRPELAVFAIVAPSSRLVQYGGVGDKGQRRTRHGPRAMGEAKDHGSTVDRSEEMPKTKSGRTSESCPITRHFDYIGAQTKGARRCASTVFGGLPRGTPRANLCCCRSVTRDPGSPQPEEARSSPGDDPHEEDRGCHQAVQTG
jgi:hypothetical protein